jgi:Leucine Rich repeats (2 copies)
LELSNNNLDELPATMDDLSALKELYVGGNEISRFPTSFALPSLTLLYAANNLLTELPGTVKNCTKLTRLNLAGNPVGHGFWSLVAQMPNLLEVEPQPGDLWSRDGFRATSGCL